MDNYYSDEVNTQILIALLKSHAIRHVIASPGTTNSALVVGLQRDPHFNVYSSVDERSSAYMACGLAAETGEPVVLSCTGATASRNYLPGMTEAYYRKIPILAIASSQATSRISHNIAQVIDNSVLPKDTNVLNLTLPIVNNEDDFWECECKVNQALIALKKRGGGPVHLNLPTTYSAFKCPKLPTVRTIHRLTQDDILPTITGRVAVFIGSHDQFSNPLTAILDEFCEWYDAPVFCDHTSSYYGKNRIQFAISACQREIQLEKFNPDILIQIGETTGDYYSLRINPKEVWRVSEDGELKDQHRRLKYIFDMPERHFFTAYSQNASLNSSRNIKPIYRKLCSESVTTIRKKIPDLPFSNIWLASIFSKEVPKGSTIHFGILNSLRAWNFFEVPETVNTNANVGGFGIDGALSTIIGASFANPDKLYFLVTGDLAFFYDLNAIGNRHIGNNLRILLVNNGKGTEFCQYNHHTSQFGNDTERFIAASGHFGNKSRSLVKGFAENLGFEYLSASDKAGTLMQRDKFFAEKIGGSPIIFEVFTDSEDESSALEKIMNTEKNFTASAKALAKKLLPKTPKSN